MEDVEDLIAEIVCIYKNIRQGRTYRTYHIKPFTQSKDSSSLASSFDFSKHRLDGKKYIFYCEELGMMQTDKLAIERKSDSFFWLNIFDPNQQDFEFLSKTFNVHETTIAEIREKNSPEKLDVYRNYAYISFRMFVNKKSTEDISFNVLVFDNAIITIHNKKWQGIGNIMNFCHVTSSVTKLNPCWVLFSIITEFHQDLLFCMDEVEKHCDSISTKHNVQELQANFSSLNQVFILKRYTRPKIKILRKFLKTDFPAKVTKKIFKGCIKDFEDIKKSLGEYKKTFERNQDMILGLRDMELAEQGHQMNVFMNRISKITFFFLPIQCVAGVWGMNVKVPWQDEKSVYYFWFLVLIGPIMCFLYFFVTERSKKSKKIKSIPSIKQLNTE